MLEYLENAELTWENGRPFSRRFGDIYGQSEHFNETKAVFIDGNQLLSRFPQSTRFVIGETGFGTGFNFLVTWHFWQQFVRPKSQLHYIAVERYPLTRTELIQSLASFPELAALTNELVAHYPPPEPGLWPLSLAQGRINLLLLFDDVSGLSDLHAQVDAWFLDGFAPRCNPDMWSEKLCHTLFSLTRPGGTLASFTVAGTVRRALEAAGFVVDKMPGFHKRERLIGQRPPSLCQPHRHLQPLDKVAIIGSGLAGASVAAALRRRGIAAENFDCQGQRAGGASGNAAGIVMPSINTLRSPNQQWCSAGFRYSVNLFNALPLLWQQCGVVKMAWNQREQQRLAAYQERLRPPSDLLTPLDAAETADYVGEKTHLPCVFYPEAGFALPPQVVDALFEGVTTRLGYEIVQLIPLETGWRLKGTHEQADFSQVIIATGYFVNFINDLNFPVVPLRGQISAFAATPQSRKLRVVYTGGGYALPATDGMHWLGATYDRGRTDCVPDEASHRDNFAKIDHDLPAFTAALGAVIEGRAALRATTPDHLPLVGEVKSGLWMTIGHGSRGLISAPLAGELLAAQLCDEPWPVLRSVAAQVSPTRFHSRIKRTTS